ncbi:MAG: ComF family protein [Bradymonadia bacterium]|jgi:ComF family protein
MSIQETLQAVKQLFWPTRCAACDILLDAKAQSLCTECRDTLRLCHYITSPSAIECACAFFMYEAAIQECIAKWKFHEDFYAQNALLSLCSEFAEKILPPPMPDSLIVSVPPHSKRLAQRGFDPAWTLAKHFQKLFGSVHGVIPQFDDEILVRTKHTPHQAGLSNEERRKNLADAFITTRQISQPVILVDDVITTGATANACAKMFVNAGATNILLVGLAYAPN